MAFGRPLALVVSLAAAAHAGGINTDAALTVGKGQVASRTKGRYADLEAAIDSFLLQQTFVYGATNQLGVFGTLGFLWSDRGPDGLTDLLLRGRWTFFNRDEKRATLSFAMLGGVEVPVGEEPIGSPDGGLRSGLVGTWERSGWRVDADVEYAWRPNASDFLRADLAVTRTALVETDRYLWLGVLELNYRRLGSDDALFLAPGVAYEVRGWKFEFSLQIAVWTDGPGPAPKWAGVLSVVHVF